MLNYSELSNLWWRKALSKDCRQIWKYADDLLFRLACYRDPDLLHKPLNEVQDAADFATIRVHGFLQSRDYQEILADFLKEAWGGNKKDSAESS